jgi:capsular exopolysaccharide synthesis family protein
METNHQFWKTVWTRVRTRVVDSSRSFFNLKPVFPFPLYEEAVYQMQTNISHLCRKKNLQSLLVTSAVPGEGKSTVAANLALALASQAHRVLLVDLDFRNPSLHQLFSVSAGPGMAEILTDSQEAHFDFSAYRLPQGIWFIPGGVARLQPAEVLDSPRLGAFLQAAASQFSSIVMDSAPVLSVSDTARLSHMADGVILVLRAGKTKTDELNQAREALAKGGSREIVGVVMNFCEEQEQFQHYGPYASPVAAEPSQAD